MLLAEIHGKRLDDARDSEDYLTSAVFGHLRYVLPAHFWADFFVAARSLPGANGEEVSLGELLAARGMSPTAYTRLDVRFWSSHPELGEPDLLLEFSGGAPWPLVVVIEVKLWAEKGGSNEKDQLLRYLGILDDLDRVKVYVPPEAGRYLVYLTPRESLSEVTASAALLPESHPSRGRLFRVQWQDVLDAAQKAALSAPAPGSMILRDVVAFLRCLGLEYFRGFTSEPLDEMPHDLGSFYHSPNFGFRGFGREQELSAFTDRGLWT